MRRLEEVEQAHIVLSLELLAQPAVMVRNISHGLFVHCVGRVSAALGVESRILSWS